MQVEIPLGTEIEERRRRKRRPERSLRAAWGGWAHLRGGGAPRRRDGAASSGPRWSRCFTGRVRAARQVAREMYWMGVQSMPIITVTGLLSGIVTSQQGGYQFTGSVPLYVLGSVVTSSIILELGPVLTAVVFIGRVGARITAELGTMKVSEQIDALYSLGRHPVRQLVAPRLIAGALVLPLLVAYANTIGIVAGDVHRARHAGAGLRDASSTACRSSGTPSTSTTRSGKGLVFGFIIPLIAAHMGLRTLRRRRGRGPRHHRLRRVHDHGRAGARRDLPDDFPEVRDGYPLSVTVTDNGSADSR